MVNSKSKLNDIIYQVLVNKISSRNIFFHIGRSTLVGQHPLKLFSSVCLSVLVSVRPSLNVFKIGSLVFSDIVHDDSWSWFVVTEEDRFFKKKNWRPKFGPNGSKLGPKWGISPFYWVWVLCFPWNCIQW